MQEIRVHHVVAAAAAAVVLERRPLDSPGRFPRGVRHVAVLVQQRVQLSVEVSAGFESKGLKPDFYFIGSRDAIRRFRAMAFDWIHLVQLPPRLAKGC